MADVGGIAGDRLRSFIERIERLQEEQQGLGDDIKDIFAKAKGVGFSTKAMREILKLRRMDKAERQEHEALVDLYKAAMGMSEQHELPLGDDKAEIRRAVEDLAPSVGSVTVTGPDGDGVKLSRDARGRFYAAVIGSEAGGP